LYPTLQLLNAPTAKLASLTEALSGLLPDDSRLHDGVGAMRALLAVTGDLASSQMITPRLDESAPAFREACAMVEAVAGARVDPYKARLLCLKRADAASTATGHGGDTGVGMSGSAS